MKSFIGYTSYFEFWISQGSVAAYSERAEEAFVSDTRTVFLGICQWKNLEN